MHEEKKKYRNPSKDENQKDYRVKGIASDLTS